LTPTAESFRPCAAVLRDASAPVLRSAPVEFVQPRNVIRMHEHFLTCHGVAWRSSLQVLALMR
jgi:hypothetical protein